MQRTYSLLATLLLTTGLGTAAAQPPTMGPLSFLPGDTHTELAVGEQDNAAIAAGGPGCLVVWQDERTNLVGHPDIPYAPLVGNQTDIYAARLDEEGNLLDASPILVCNLGRNQTRPQVAWNGESWLVVFVSQRPDWYFFEDILGVRVSPDGEVLDPEPIPLRLEHSSPSNDRASNPTVTSDGTNWLAIWQDQIYESQIPRLNIAGKRIATDGTVLDSDPVVLYQHDSEVFGPVHPHIAWATGEYLLVYERAGFGDLYGRRIQQDLTPIDPSPFLINGDDTFPRVASNGTDFLVSGRSRRVYRVDHDGAVLDPGGISLQIPDQYQPRAPRVSWDGLTWLATASGGSADVYLTRIQTDGTVVPPGGVAVHPSGSDQYSPAVASPASGLAQIVWSSRNGPVANSIRGIQVDEAGSAGPLTDVGTGWHRQTYLHFDTGGDQQMAVFASAGGGASRILAQRFGLDGQPIDAEPVEVVSYAAQVTLRPQVAWNGTYFHVAWTHESSIYVRRIDANGALVDPAPVLLITDSAVGVGIGALGEDLYIAYPYTFSGDQQPLKGVRVDGADLSLMGSPQMIGFDFSFTPLIRALGSRWLLVWERQVSHDDATSWIYGKFVEPSGAVGSEFTINGSGLGDYPGLAIGSDQACVVWYDNATYTNWRVEGRLLNPDGSFASPEFLLCDAANHQFLPSVGWDGSQYVAAWSDARDLLDIEALRPDVYAARIDTDGTVLDPCGFQVTEGPLPEDLPAVAGGSGVAMVAFSALHGAGGPEIQRIGYRLIGVDPSATEENLAGDLTDGPRVRIGPNPFRDDIRIAFSPSARAKGPATIRILSLDGRVMHTARVSDERHVWDGTRATGATVTSGVYLVRIDWPDGTTFARRVLKIR